MIFFQLVNDFDRMFPSKISNLSAVYKNILKRASKVKKCATTAAFISRANEADHGKTIAFSLWSINIYNSTI